MYKRCLRLQVVVSFLFVRWNSKFLGIWIVHSHFTRGVPDVHIIYLLDLCTIANLVGIQIFRFLFSFKLCIFMSIWCSNSSWFRKFFRIPCIEATHVGAKKIFCNFMWHSLISISIPRISKKPHSKNRTRIDCHLKYGYTGFVHISILFPLKLK